MFIQTQPINPDLILGRLEAGTLLRHAWGDGRKRACLLAALAPQCARTESASACPASVMPLWLAELTLWMDDKGTEGVWEPFVRRYAAVAARWHKLDGEGWRRVFLGSLVVILEIARPHDTSGACEAVIALCHEGAAPQDPRWSAAKWVAESKSNGWTIATNAATAAAANAAAATSEAVAWGAKANEVAAVLVTEAALGAVKATTWVAADVVATTALTWDRMTAGILAVIEAECD